jgi:hypothetical protein
VRDGINLTKLGHPALVIVQKQFEKVAREQARALGMPDLRICSYAWDATGGASTAQDAEQAKRVIIELPQLLLARSH